jgi:hypothetical protein
MKAGLRELKDDPFVATKLNMLLLPCIQEVDEMMRKDRAIVREYEQGIS